MKRKITVLLLIIGIFIIGNTKVFALESEVTKKDISKDMVSVTRIGALEDPLSNPNAYIPGTNWSSNNSKLAEMGKGIVGAIQIIGVIVAVVTFMVIGIKYMYASLEERASLKERMIPYLIGAIMVFAITTLVNIIYTFVTGISI